MDPVCDQKLSYPENPCDPTASGGAQSQWDSMEKRQWTSRKSNALNGGCTIYSTHGSKRYLETMANGHNFLEQKQDAP